MICDLYRELADYYFSFSIFLMAIIVVQAALILIKIYEEYY